MGPSPRVRGSHQTVPAAHVAPRSIPACAGKPSTRGFRRALRRVHPRVCGEARSSTAFGSPVTGPSPRVRGSRTETVRWLGPLGSIPACAGKPSSHSRASAGLGVHPRVCGEAQGRPVAPVGDLGPSPRVRGSPHAPGDGSTRSRSIPACAGKPRPSRLTAAWSRVHPRVCGEATRPATRPLAHPGPSPRVRGSHGLVASALPQQGSIPACAGKPGAIARRDGNAAVHPRVCGEAVDRRPDRMRHPGPSPRVRGSPAGPSGGAAGRRSIPACAGKPRMTRARASRHKVHPRVCGEAAATWPVCSVASGPSPRVRGSLGVALPDLERLGSIPACAGKPREPAPLVRAPEVHPRVCGEAIPAACAIDPRRGPSPRVRGSRQFVGALV